MTVVSMSAKEFSRLDVLMDLEAHGISEARLVQGPG